jgi:hypothetical protein
MSGLTAENNLGTLLVLYRAQFPYQVWIIVVFIIFPFKALGLFGSQE